jgi:hypothetical protein
MGQPIPAQHPSVVLRSHANRVKALLAVALAAVVALSTAVVIDANDNDQVSGGTTAAKPIDSINYQGFNPATGRPDSVQPQQLPAGTRFDGGPDEGTRGLSVQPEQLPAGTRFDGGPDEGSRGPAPLQVKEPAGGPRMIPQGPGAR